MGGGRGFEFSRRGMREKVKILCFVIVKQKKKRALLLYYSRRQQLAPPPRDAAKMSPRISICPEVFLAAHAPSPPAAGRHCPAREVSAPHCGTEFRTD